MTHARKFLLRSRVKNNREKDYSIFCHHYLFQIQVFDKKDSECVDWNMNLIIDVITVVKEVRKEKTPAGKRGAES